MENFMRFLSDIRVIIVIAVIIVLLIIYFIVHRATASKYRKQLEALEVRYNTLKSEPLSLKLTRADAISRVDPEARTRIVETKDEFEKTQANLRQIQQALADTEDEILVGKLKQAKLDLADLEASVTLGEKQVKNLNAFLDTILKKETEQRERVNQQKARFRNLKQEAQDRSTELSFIWPVIEKNTTDIEKMFSAYEEWSYANDFEKASKELDEIETGLDSLESMIHGLPSVLEDARGVVPNMIENLRNENLRNKARGVLLDHLQVDQNLNIITTSLKEDLSNLKEGKVDDVETHVADYKAQLTKLRDQVQAESKAFDDMNGLFTSNNELIQNNTSMLSEVRDQYNRISQRFGLSKMQDAITSAASELNGLIEEEKTLEERSRKQEVPASGELPMVRKLQENLQVNMETVRKLKDEIDRANADEKNARTQLTKLQVVMNDMQVKIRKNKLPSVSEQYHEDIVRADQYIHTIDDLLKQKTLDVELLNSTLTEAIDFIYKLYQNVNNMVATVVMYENTVVFGNRYRSTYADIDSELTRSELCFRNGEYTQALTIAIATMEKIHPGTYESMIKENAKSAA